MKKYIFLVILIIIGISLVSADSMIILKKNIVNSNITYNNIQNGSSASIPPYTIYKKYENDSNTAVTYIYIDNLSMPLNEIGAIYKLDCALSYRTAGTGTGVNITLNYPTSYASSFKVEICGITNIPGGTDSCFTGQNINSGSSGRTVSTGVAVSNTNYPMLITGTIVPKAIGQLNFSFATEVSGSAVWIMNGSNCILWNLGK